MTLHSPWQVQYHWCTDCLDHNPHGWHTELLGASRRCPSDRRPRHTPPRNQQFHWRHGATFVIRKWALKMWNFYFFMQWAAVSTQFSFRMVPPQPWSPSHCSDTTKGYLPWGASVPFTTRWGAAVVQTILRHTFTFNSAGKINSCCKSQGHKKGSLLNLKLKEYYIFWCLVTTNNHNSPRVAVARANMQTKRIMV